MRGDENALLAATRRLCAAERFLRVRKRSAAQSLRVAANKASEENAENDESLSIV